MPPRSTMRATSKPAMPFVGSIQRPLEGLEFAGRIAEDFKLLSATWVQASIVRRDLVEALQPYVIDAVICAPDRPWLGALVWLAVPEDAAVRAALAKKLGAFNGARQGSADTIARLLILKDPPSAEAGEITDKRSINQRLAMQRRASDVALLYADPRPAHHPAEVRSITPQRGASCTGRIIAEGCCRSKYTVLVATRGTVVVGTPNGSPVFGLISNLVELDEVTVTWILWPFSKVNAVFHKSMCSSSGLPGFISATSSGSRPLR